MESQREPQESVYSVWVTGECNNDCIFCDSHPGTRGPSLEEVRERLLAARRDGFDVVSFIGGEPTFRQDFVQLVGLARRLGFGRIHVNTNGRRFSDLAFALACARAGLSNVTFTLYSHDPSVHDAITRRPGSWRESVEGIVNMVSISRGLGSRPGGRKIAISGVVVLSRENMDTLPSTLSFMRSLGVERITLRACVPTHSALRNRAVPVYSKHRDTISMVVKENENVVTAGVPFCLLGGKIETEEMEKRRLLIEDHNRLVIDREKEIRESRRYKPECRDCVHHGLCPGFHEKHPHLEVETVWPEKREKLC